jgi:hypothetical protein
VESAENGLCLVVSVLFDKPRRRLAQKPDADGYGEAGDELKGQGESLLKVGVDFKAAVTEPLGYEKAPRQNELQKARELPTTLRRCDL